MSANLFFGLPVTCSVVDITEYFKLRVSGVVRASNVADIATYLLYSVHDTQVSTSLASYVFISHSLSSA